MDRQTALQLALAAQHMAREQFRGSYDLAAATTEDAVSDGWRAAGLRPAGQETIRVRKLAGALAGIERYRMTLLDWDAVCL
jgi:hypothetical protein